MRSKKYFFKKLPIFLSSTLLLFSFLFSSAYAIQLTSTNFIISDPVIGTGGGYGTSTNFKAFSAGHTLLSGYATSTNFKAKYGFLYFSNEAETLTFDLDTSVADAETDPTYSVALGTVTTTDTRVSGSTDSINMIIAEADTNATGGVVVTVKSTNGSNGLVSTAVPADNIGSADGTMADGTENYGLCVATSGLSGFSRASPYNSGACALNSETNAIQGLTTTGENILNSGGAALSDGHAEIMVNAAVSGVTPAHTDYTDTITFIATGTF